GQGTVFGLGGRRGGSGRGDGGDGGPGRCGGLADAGGGEVGGDGGGADRRGRRGLLEGGDHFVADGAAGQAGPAHAARLDDQGAVAEVGLHLGQGFGDAASGVGSEDHAGCSCRATVATTWTSTPGPISEKAMTARSLWKREVMP